MLTEKQVENQICDYIKSIGGFVTKVHSGKVKVIKVYGKKSMGMHKKTTTSWMQLASKGTPDLFVIILNKKGISTPVLIEVKKSDAEAARWERIVTRYINKGHSAKSNHREVMQYERMSEAIKCGAICMVCGSVESVEKEFKRNNLI